MDHVHGLRSGLSEYHGLQPLQMLQAVLRYRKRTIECLCRAKRVNAAFVS